MLVVRSLSWGFLEFEYENLREARSCPVVQEALRILRQEMTHRRMNEVSYCVSQHKANTSFIMIRLLVSFLSIVTTQTASAEYHQLIYISGIDHTINKRVTFNYYSLFLFCLLLLIICSYCSVRKAERPVKQSPKGGKSNIYNKDEAISWSRKTFKGEISSTVTTNRNFKSSNTSVFFSFCATALCCLNFFVCCSSHVINSVVLTCCELYYLCSIILTQQIRNIALFLCTAFSKIILVIIYI